jgi:outer membrane protein
MKRRLFSIVLFLCFATTGYAQRAWSLAECIAYAKEHNISIKEQELSRQESQLSMSQSKYDYLPTIGLSNHSQTTHKKVFETTTNEYIKSETTTDLDAALVANVDLFTGFKKIRRMELASLNFQASLANILKSQNDVTLNVTAAYFEILFAEESSKVAEHKIATIKLQEAKTTQLVKAKTKTIGDLLQIQAQLAEAENDIISVHGQKQKACLNLCQLLEIENYHDFQVLIPDTFEIVNVAYSARINAIVETAQVLPEITGAQLKISIAGKSIDIAKADLYPTLTLSAGYGSFYSDARKKMLLDEEGLPVMNDQNELTYRKYPFMGQIKDNVNTYIALNLTIPLFDAFKKKSNVKINQIAKQRAEYELFLAQKQLTKTIEELFIDADVAFQRYQSSLTAVKSSEEAFRYVENKFNANMATSVDYYIALDNLIKSQSALVQAKYEYIFKTKLIDFYSGKSISLE